MQLLKFLKGEQEEEITKQYGFKLSEAEIQDFIQNKKGSDPEKEKAYAQLECYDCLMLTN